MNTASGQADDAAMISTNMNNPRGPVDYQDASQVAMGSQQQIQMMGQGTGISGQNSQHHLNQQLP